MVGLLNVDNIKRRLRLDFSDLYEDGLSFEAIDLIESNLKHLKTNKLNFLINQNPIQQGFLGIMNLVKHLILKQPVDRLQHLPLDIVVNENVAYYLNQELHSEILI